MVIDLLEVDNIVIKQDELAYIEANDCDHITIKACTGTRIMFIGAEPLPHPVVLWWNFVDKDKSGIEPSIKDWNNHRPCFCDVAVNLPRLIAPQLPKVPLSY